MTFQDHFSGHAAVYASARPDYPPQLFEFLASCCNVRHLAWDCATGNGQAAVALAAHFERVVASDGSAKQIAEAMPRPNIDYCCAPAEASPLEDGVVDLVTVAQALHWFNVDAFYAEAARVLKPGGVLAVWCYGIHRIDTAIDDVVGELYEPVLGPWWPPERKLVERHYQDLSFPFAEMPPPTFDMRQRWTLQQLTAYLYSWSATQRYMQDRKEDPVLRFSERLAAAWGGEPLRDVVWPLTLRLGRRP